MRVTVQPNDRGYDARVDISRSRIWLDGKPIEGAITADTEEGMALVFAVNAEGHTYIDPNDPDEWATTILRGRVRIERWCWLDDKPTIAETRTGSDFSVHLRF